MLAYIVAVLLSLGFISSADSYENLTEQEQQEFIEANDIVIQDELSW